MPTSSRSPTSAPIPSPGATSLPAASGGVKGKRSVCRGRWATQPPRRQGEHRAPQTERGDREAVGVEWRALQCGKGLWCAVELKSLPAFHPLGSLRSPIPLPGRGYCGRRNASPTGKYEHHRRRRVSRPGRNGFLGSPRLARNDTGIDTFCHPERSANGTKSKDLRT